MVLRIEIETHEQQKKRKKLFATIHNFVSSMLNKNRHKVTAKHNEGSTRKTQCHWLTENLQIWIPWKRH